MAADSGIMAGDSGVMAGESGVFEKNDPFFTGNPEQMPELGSITSGDATAFAHENPAARSGVREFEFDPGDGDTLELADLDLPSPAASGSFGGGPASSDPYGGGSFESGLDLPAPSDSFGAGNFETDLDLPASADPYGGAGNFETDLDLPASADPYGGGAGNFETDLDLPAPTEGFNPDFDLPAPAADLPAPATNLPAPADDFPVAADDLPMPADDLPMPADDLPAGFDGDLSIDDLPMPADDLPAPADNLPTALDDFPAPAPGDLPELEGFDELPTSADILPGELDDFPAPVDSLPTAAQNLPKSADILPTPVDSLELDLDGYANPPSRKPAKPSNKAGDGPGIALDDTDDGPSPGPSRGPRPGPQTGAAKPPRNFGRIIGYSLVGLVVLGVGGGLVAMKMGLLDDLLNPPPPPPPTQTQDSDGEPPPSGEPVPRSEAVMVKFDQDTPASYVQAYAIAESDEDSVGMAEAALLLHHRYGPDPARQSEAGRILAGYEGRPEPHVRRVLGLALLSQGKTDQALALFDADGPRTALYKSWALLAKGDADQARAAAEAAVATRPNDQAAQLTVLEVRYLANPVDGLAAMRQAAKTSPNHLALQETLMRAAANHGRLAEAAQIGETLQPTSISDPHRAELLRLRAGVAIAQGLAGEAMRLYDQAIAADPSLVGARVDRVDLLLVNKDFATARGDIEVLLREEASRTDPRVLKAAARVELEAGRDDDARAHLTKLEDGGANDPEAQDLLAQADAILMKLDEARATWAKARTLDPNYTPALDHEIELLLRIEQEDEALALLDAQAAALEAGGAKNSERGRQALANVARIRAVVLRDRDLPDQALTAAEEAISLNPASNGAMLIRAELLGALGKRNAHEEALLELHERTGGYPGLTEPLGKVFLRKNQLSALEKLIGSSLDSPDASREIILTGAALRLAQAKPEDAQVLAQRVLDRDPTDSRGHLLLGRALLDLGDYARALDEIENAQTREGDPEVELWLGQALEYNQRAGEARVHYTRALELDPQSLEAAALLGRIYAYEGAAAKAIELLAPVVSQTDAYPYAYLALGLARKDLGRRDLAIAEFQKAQQLDPTLFEAYYQEGRIHNDQNNHGAAVNALQAGIDKAKQNATERALVDTYRRLGESYVQLGRRGEAKAALQEYMKLAPSNAAGRREVERLLRDL